MAISFDPLCRLVAQYPKCDGLTWKEGTNRITAHTDESLMTLLFTSPSESFLGDRSMLIEACPRYPLSFAPRSMHCRFWHECYCFQVALALHNLMCIAVILALPRG